MFKFIIKRLGISALVMLAASVILFILTINAGDPLGDLRESTSPNRQNLIDRRIAVMHLNDPWYTRYFAWLGGTSKCFVGACDFGTNFRGQRVNDLLVDAMGSSLRLVFLSTVFAIVLGVFFGVMTAIRQYSGFDYVVTFISFAFFSLPSFVFAVLLKEYGAIKFNDWLEDPTISFATTVLFAAIFALFAQSLVGGSLRRRAYAGAGAFLFALVALVVPSVVARIAHMVGVGRGTDLLLYVLVVAFLAQILSSFRRNGARERQITHLARRIALDNAPEPPDGTRRTAP